MKKIVFVAGDKSGDLYAGLLCNELKNHYGQNVELYSLGGPVLARHSRQLIDLVSLSVSGIIEVAAHFKELTRTFSRSLQEIRALKPDLIIFVDFPDFNLRLAEKLQGLCPLFYYISPQVWAWRKQRVHTIKKLIDKMIVLFDFEQELYRKAGLDALFFGHPLLDIIPDIEHKPEDIILFLPGSRKNEVAQHLPLMREIKNALSSHVPEYRFQIVKPENIERRFYKELIGDEIKVVPHSYETISRARFIVASSGTATLELAILNIPFCILYRLNTLTWWLLKNLVHIKFIGLPNIICNEKIIDEFIQFQARPPIMANYVLSFLTDQEKYSGLKSRLTKVKDKLTPYDALKNTATYIGNYLNL